MWVVRPPGPSGSHATPIRNRSLLGASLEEYGGHPPLNFQSCQWRLFVYILAERPNTQYSRFLIPNTIQTYGFSLQCWVLESSGSAFHQGVPKRALEVVHLVLKGSRTLSGPLRALLGYPSKTQGSYLRGSVMGSRTTPYTIPPMVPP